MATRNKQYPGKRGFHYNPIAGTMDVFLDGERVGGFASFETLYADPTAAGTAEWAMVQEKVTDNIDKTVAASKKMSEEGRKQHAENIANDKTRATAIDNYTNKLRVLQANAKTAFVVGQARGVIVLAGTQKKIPFAIYTPLQVKMAVTGYGRAEKSQVGKMVQNVLTSDSIPTPDDTNDALAVALHHAFSQKMERKYDPSTYSGLC